MDFSKFDVLILIGKGGVGKTTCSSALAVGLAERGYKTLLVSIDPAHNLGDVLKIDVGRRMKKVKENLYAVEIDIDEAVGKYLKELEESLKSLYRYLTVINLEKYLEIMRYTPGVEEYAILEAIKDILSKRGEFDKIVFDTPPTGLTVRILALPKTSLIWLEKLIELRRKILDRRLSIERVKGKITFKVGDREIKLPSREEEDRVIQELRRYKSETERVYKTFTDERTAVIGVVNPDELSLIEMERTIEVLKKMGISIRLVIVNKYEGGDLEGISERLKTEVVKVTKKPKEVRGIEELGKLFEEIA